MAPAASRAAAATPADSIELAAATPWLTGNNSFHLAVTVHSPLAANNLSLSLELYPKVTGRSDFEQTLSGAPVANVLEALPIPLDVLGVQGKAGPTSATVSTTLPVTTGEQAVGTPSPAAPTLTLDCDLSPPPCQGVYPLQVSLVNLAGVPLSSFTTYVVYAPPLQGAMPLRVGWVLPMTGSPTLAPDGRPSLSTGDEGAVGATAAALDAYPQVGVTVETTGETVESIVETPGALARTVAGELRTLAGDPSHEVVDATYAPVDPVEIAQSGLAGELAVQLQAGAGELRRDLSPDVALPSRPWVLDAPVDPVTLALLAQDGVGEVVLPDTYLASDGWPYTATEPFTLTESAPGGQGVTVDAIAADSELASHFSNSGNPIEDAEDLLADLAEIFFEAPYAHAPATGTTYDYQPRSVALETPASWRTNPTMLHVLLAGLAQAQQDHILQPTTVSGLFAGDPPGADGEPRTRTLTAASVAATATAPTDGASAADVAAARAGIAAFASLVPSATAEVAVLQRDVLGGEARNLAAAARSTLLGAATAQIAAAGGQLSLPQGPIVDLTSSTGQVPITIASRSAVPLHVDLVLANPSLGLRFPGGSSIPLVISRRTTVEDVEISSRTSGDFALRLTLVTPVGAVAVGHGNLTIRSTALSGLAVALSLGALALLVVWWIRSSRRRRRELAAAGEGEDPGAG